MMSKEEVEQLYEALKRFLSSKCVGCDQCTSTEEICNRSAELKIILREALVKRGIK